MSERTISPQHAILRKVSERRHAKSLLIKLDVRMAKRLMLSEDCASLVSHSLRGFHQFDRCRAIAIKRDMSSHESVGHAIAPKLAAQLFQTSIAVDGSSPYCCFRGDCPRIPQNRVTKGPSNANGLGRGGRHLGTK